MTPAEACTDSMPISCAVCSKEALIVDTADGCDPGDWHLLGDAFVCPDCIDEYLAPLAEGGS